MSKKTPPVWVARAGRHGEDKEAALTDGQVIIGFRKFPDLTLVHEGEEGGG